MDNTEGLSQETLKIDMGGPTTEYNPTWRDFIWLIIGFFAPIKIWHAVNYAAKISKRKNDSGDSAV